MENPYRKYKNINMKEHPFFKEMQYNGETFLDAIRYRMSFESIKEIIALLKEYR